MKTGAALLETSAPRGGIATAAVCAHCGSSLADGAERFCCGGCAAAYRLIEDLGLNRYYDGRHLDPQMRLPRPVSEPIPNIAEFAGAGGDGTRVLHLMVDGLHCAACVWLIENVLARQPEVSEARVNLTSRRLRLAWRGDAQAGLRLVELVQRLGYRVMPYDPQRLAGQMADEERRLLRALAVAGFAAANVMLLSIAIWAGIDGGMGQATRDLLHWVSALIALPAVAYAGQPFFRSAWRALRHGRTNMDVPISVGVTLATAMSLFETINSGRQAYFESAVMLLFFLLIGRYLDLRARGRARSAAEQLVGLMAQPATVIDADGATRRMPAASVAVGDTLLVAAGERITADGRIAQGQSSIDKSMIDGESMPADVAPGSMVFAGMVNLAAPLRIVVTATGERTFLAEIARLMESAEQGRARLVVLADRIARLYAPAVHLLAILTFVAWAFLGPWQAALLNAVAVLIITCPCALGLAVPAVQVIASGRLMRRGILLKSATALERLAAVDTVAFDKTGTLTLNRIELRRDPGIPPAALRLASGLAAASRHPLSESLRRACPEAPPLAGVAEHPGAGLAANTPDGQVRLGSRAFCAVTEAGDDGLPELWLAQPNSAPRRFVFSVSMRPDAAAVVSWLRRNGTRVLLLSGDRPAVVADFAREVGIAEWHAALGPGEKCAALAALAAEGRKVLMVGDGLNDAPALSAAFVSMSPASAADVSQTAADVVFQGQSLGAVSETLMVARQSARLVHENLAFAIGYNALAVPLAMLGQVTPLLAAAAMSSSSLVVVGNALRLSWRRQ
ncbi:MAG TPA: heavy metal translocating P-type ATPase metal-binding domain-containing protein [Candidatus Cybelea sp.]|nr:heavy metal translocating P-type ATPase metal-binding domain-containing protein [Candidatus Cybelea sp.]